jgi:hypothetical chaperone protein
MSNYLGIDFGTTNSLAGIIKSGKLDLIRLEHDGFLMPTALFIEYPENFEDFDSESSSFFSLLDSQNCIKYFGIQAVNKYKNEPLSGYFIRSIKSFLAAKIAPIHQELFVKVIKLILSEIKNIAERQHGVTYKGVVLGHPVNYMGSNSDDANQQALRIMRRAANLSGFDDVRFVIEPLAASLVSREIYASQSPALVIDIGGGTTDVVLIGRNDEDIERLKILGTSGERIGGSDFDEKIAINKIGPLIGYGATLSNGKRLPNHIVLDALSTRDIHKQKKFRESHRDIVNFIQNASDQVLAVRFNQIFKKQLQHQLIGTAESCKLDLSDQVNTSKSINLSLYSFEINITKDELDEICQLELKQIKKIIFNAFNDYDQKNPFRIFLTGGMSNSPSVINLVREIIPGQTINQLPPFESIVAGLALVSRELTLSEETYAESFNVRGIPVTR